MKILECFLSPCFIQSFFADFSSLLLQAQLNELMAAYKKAHKVELADEIDKKCSGDLKALMLAKLGHKGENCGSFNLPTHSVFDSLVSVSNIVFFPFFSGKEKEKPKKQQKVFII